MGILTVIIALAVLLALWGIRARSRNETLADSDRSYDPSPGERFPHLWGYTDTRFEFCDDRTVRVTGGRYPLAGAPLPRFVPYVEDLLGVPIKPELFHAPASPAKLPASARNEPFMADLAEKIAPERITTSDEERLVHSHGQLSVEEIFNIINGHAPERVVDAVVYPQNEAEVIELVRLADRHGVVLIPYGGGTNVSGALLCPVGEERMILSVDMRRMNRIIEIDRENKWAVIEAGITGKDLELQLEEAGLTCGHVPDSIELSTLGGWIATNASGMKKNRYGNIESIVLEATLVTPRGEVRSCPVNPRCATGVDPRQFLFGSEGSLGIITRATLHVRPLPDARKFASFVFPDFATGIKFLKEVEISGAKPASLRLTNNTEFSLGRALISENTRLRAFIFRLKASYVVKVKGFDPKRMVACTAVMEGTAGEVRQQEATLGRILKKVGGLSGGSDGGKRGYRLTFAIAYIRDFLNCLGVIGETFETSAPWGRVEAITGAVEEELHRLCKSYGVTGRPFLSYRISQSYPAGVCIYFTMGLFGRGLKNPAKSYQEIEHRLREVILEQGGSLSHHHGVGKIRRDFIPRVHSQASIEGILAIKRALDPSNVFGARNNVFGLEGGDQNPKAGGNPAKKIPS